MPQTATAQKPETTGHISILAALLEGINSVDINTYAPEEPHKCSHYVEVGIVTNESTKRMVALRFALIEDYNKKVKVLNEEGRTRESIDAETARFLADTSVKIETLGSLVNYQVELEFPDLKKVGVPLSFGPGWMLSYTDHSLASFLGDMAESGDEMDLPPGLKDLLGGLGGMAVVIGGRGFGRAKDKPPVQ